MLCKHLQQKRPTGRPNAPLGAARGSWGRPGTGRRLHDVHGVARLDLGARGLPPPAAAPTPGAPAHRTRAPPWSPLLAPAQL